MTPTAIDLFCGLGGWTEGLLAEDYRVVGFDIEEHVYGEHRYPGKLILADVLTLHGSMFARADLIVASPPCQEYSYMAMPWKRAKAKAAAIRADTTGAELARLTQLFSACFRIQREASEAAGHHIPMVVENVRGAQPWVGKAQGNFGSFYLWGDVPALMPITLKASKVPGFRFDGSGKSFQTASVQEHTKNNGGSWFNVAHNTTSGKGRNPDGRKMPGIKLREVGFNVAAAQQYGHMVEGAKYQRSEDDKRQYIGVKRKMASAMIAKIPLPLSRYIAATFKPIMAKAAE